MDVHEAFNDSYVRCLEDSRFTERFYMRFIAQSPAIRQLFEGVDMQRQQRMLELSIFYIILAGTSMEARERLVALAKRHGLGGYGVTLEMYDEWKQCMIDTVAECDRKFDLAVSEAWSEILERGLGIMRRHAVDSPECNVDSDAA